MGECGGYYYPMRARLLRRFIRPRDDSDSRHAPRAAIKRRREKYFPHKAAEEKGRGKKLRTCFWVGNGGVMWLVALCLGARVIIRLLDLTWWNQSCLIWLGGTPTLPKRTLYNREMVVKWEFVVECTQLTLILFATILDTPLHIQLIKLDQQGL